MTDGSSFLLFESHQQVCKALLAAWLIVLLWSGP